MVWEPWVQEHALFSEFDRLSSHLNRLLAGFGGPARSGLSLAGAGVYPPLNLYDDGESLIARAEVPGINPKDLDVTVAGSTLTLRGERKDEKHAGASYHRRERDSGAFHRTLTLPEQVDASKVIATCKDGVLEVRMPRAGASRPRKVNIE